tara:strand:+ start:1747 stop:2529 length:783 start_codon:yes stop_codon:yes gene_type:complete
MINLDALKNAAEGWTENAPFPHLVVDNFFVDEVAEQLEKDFPDFDDNSWFEYGNALEVKKTCNSWNFFPKLTYQAFMHLNSQGFTSTLSNYLFDDIRLSSDGGLNGGGWHIHKSGGKLNQHLDYSLHPKLNLQRKVNIIVYLNSNWESSWGGNLGFWGNESSKKPGLLIKEVEPLFNRAVIFDTTCNSWHGLPGLLNCPETEFRKSMAVYYLTQPPENVDTRGKALFAPTDDQQGDEEVLELIRIRSAVDTASSAYIAKK